MASSDGISLSRLRQCARSGSREQSDRDTGNPLAHGINKS
jgi:hypothetical protein